MILLIDNYDSFVHNLARYVRELGGDAVVRRNDEVTLADARARTGSHHLRLDRERRTVVFDCQGIQINLGSIGTTEVVPLQIGFRLSSGAKAHSSITQLIGTTKVVPCYKTRNS